MCLLNEEEEVSEHQGSREVQRDTYGSEGSGRKPIPPSFGLSGLSCDEDGLCRDKLF